MVCGRGGDIRAAVYDQAIDRCQPPMGSTELEAVVSLCVQGIATRHIPQTPVKYEGSDYLQEITATRAQSNFAALLGAASIRLKELINS